ncbi:hypothetical protein BLNAU_25045 [Blattamonas nauphoetae]|uniref:Uncharacterized protein n=1 Tax=Blattamonas nauphoetae TaxID=2049346 RepID=A0ABQ9WKP2_9EUKA|nr:hypothetical protein BLNAU_25045 [Blattamonas nauphoetae]
MPRMIVVVPFCILSGDDRLKTGHLLFVTPVNHLKGRTPVCTDLDWNLNTTTRNADQKEKRIPNEQNCSSS